MAGYTPKPVTERVRALADISRSALCCHSNETRAPISNPPNSAQLEGTRYHSPKLHPGPCSNVGMRRGTDRHTADGRDQYRFRLGYSVLFVRVLNECSPVYAKII